MDDLPRASFDDLLVQLLDIRRTLQRIEAEMGLIRSMVVSHGQRLAWIEEKFIEPHQKPSNGE